jgi:hypothetical protein
MTMMSRTLSALAVAALVLATPPAAAQRRGTVEVVGFTRYVNFDNSLGMSSTIAVGGRATMYLGPALALDLDVAHGSSSSISYTPVHLRLVDRVSVGSRMEALLGAGYVRNWYGAPYTSDGGLSVLLGLGYQLNGRLWLRGGLDLDAMFHTATDSPFSFYNGNWGLHLGVGLPFNR